jgi:hypothetical protein
MPWLRVNDELKYLNDDDFDRIKAKLNEDAPKKKTRKKSKKTL